jgi:hypothetical protein
MQGFPDAHEALLGRVFSLRRLAQQGQAQSVQPPLIAPEQQLEGLRMGTAPDQLDDIGVAGAGVGGVGSLHELTPCNLLIPRNPAGGFSLQRPAMLHRFAIGGLKPTGRLRGISDTDPLQILEERS